MSVRLPGGIWDQNDLHHSLTLAPWLGSLELGLYEAWLSRLSYPDFVTRAIALGVASVGSLTMSMELARQLSSADRQWIILKMAEKQAGESYWFSPLCPHCQESFDVPINRAAIPFKQACKDPQPWLWQSSSETPLQVLPPNGYLEEALALCETEEQIQQAIQQTLLPSSSSHALSEKDFQQLEFFLEEKSAAVTDQVSTQCPNCDQPVVLDLEFSYGLVNHHILTEIHKIALYYHWSEAEILHLPRQRRRLYLKLIDQNRGMTQ